MVNALYSRSVNEFARGTFRVKGDVIDVYPAYADNGIRVQFFGDEIEKIKVLMLFVKQLLVLTELIFILLIYL